MRQIDSVEPTRELSGLSAVRGVGEREAAQPEPARAGGGAPPAQPAEQARRQHGV